MSLTQEFVEEFDFDRITKSDYDKFMSIERWFRKNLPRKGTRTLTLDGSDFSHRSARWWRDEFADPDGYPDSIIGNMLITDLIKMDFDPKKVILGEETLIIPGAKYEGCADCGERLEYHLCGTNLQIHGQHKKHCETYENFYVLVNFPSGEAIVGDCITEIHEYIDVHVPTRSQSLKSECEIAKAYADAGMLYMSIGNSCPIIGQKPNELFFGDETTSVYNEATEEYEDINCPEFEGWTEIGNICTDNWSVNAIDVQTLREICAKHPELDSVEIERRYQKIKIEPGVWKFTDYHMTNYGEGNVRVRGERLFETILSNRRCHK